MLAPASRKEMLNGELSRKRHVLSLAGSQMLFQSPHEQPQPLAGENPVERVGLQAFAELSIGRPAKCVGIGGEEHLLQAVSGRASAIRERLDQVHREAAVVLRRERADHPPHEERLEVGQGRITFGGVLTTRQKQFEDHGHDRGGVHRGEAFNEQARAGGGGRSSIVRYIAAYRPMVSNVRAGALNAVAWSRKAT